MNGSVHCFFAEDHRRLGALLASSVAEDGTVDLESFGVFRAGILRHIGMEEKVLFPALQRTRGGEPHPDAAGLRVDHGAIAAILVATPTPALIGQITSVLVPHNRREEQSGGIYAAADEALGTAAAERLVEELRAFPEPPLKPYNDGPRVMEHIRETLEKAHRHRGD
jgi:hypothetical protein